MVTPPSFGEEELKWKFGRCVNDLAVKSAVGSGLAYMAAKWFLEPRRRKGAVMTSLGAAIGLSYFQCERELRDSMRSCKHGVGRIIVCEECKASLELQVKKREARQKELEERKKRIEMETESQ